MFPRAIAILAFSLLSSPSFAFQNAAQLNDSARIYLDHNNTKAARVWIEKARKANGNNDDKIWTSVLTANIWEEEGYVNQTLEGYRVAVRDARQAQAHPQLAAGLNGLASILFSIGKYDSIEAFLQESRKLDPSFENLAKNYIVEGRFYQSQNMYDLALTSMHRAFDEATKAKDKRNIAIALSNIGGIYFSHNPDMSHAIGYYERSIAACDSSIHFNILARNYGRLANSYMVLGKLDNAKRYLDRARTIVDRSDNLPVRGYILASHATFLGEQGKFNEAIILAEEPIRIKRELGQLRQLQNDLLNIAESYMMVKKYHEAEVALTEGASIGYQLHDIVYLKYFYDKRSVLDSLQGNYKAAYSNLKKSMIYKDSTFSSQHLRDVRDVQEKYEAEQKEKVIAQQKLEIEQQKYQQVLTVGAFAIVSLILLGGLVIVRLRSRSRLQLERERQHHARLATIVKTQEEVQQRIARDLHDGLVQVLGAAKMSLQATTLGSDTSTLQRQIRGASDMIDEAVGEARTISHQILPYSLLKNGLISALEELFSRSLESHTFEHNGEVQLPEQTSVNIYRIAQEITNNIQKHSSATRVMVKLTSSTHELKLLISDNGRGFDKDTIIEGAGLSNIQTRAEMIGATIEVTSSPGRGTTTELTVPI